MDTKFSPHIKEVISISREESLRLGHDFISIQHLFLGLIKHEKNIPCLIMKNQGVDIDSIKSTIEKELSKGEVNTSNALATLPLTKKAEKVLKVTVLEARVRSSNEIDNEHLLLSILKEENLTSKVLKEVKFNYDIFDSELNNIPVEIRKIGFEAVLEYTRELEKGAVRLNEARLIILGDKGAGKTCLAKKLVDPNAKMTDDSESTAGVDTSFWKLEDEEINIHIWDFAGHTVTHAVHQFFLSERSLYVIVFDGRTEERNRLEYWLNHMKNYGANSKAMILVNKKDQHCINLPINYLKEKYQIEGIYYFSLKDDVKDLLKFRKSVSEYVTHNPSWKKQEIPVNYYHAKEELERYFVKGSSKKGVEHISIDQFNSIARKFNIKDSYKLLKSLHHLGISLWYEDMEKFNTLILNPEWISHGVYKIINWLNNENIYHLSINDFDLIFDDDLHRYPRKKREYLYELMIHYELAYEAKKDNVLIVPHLLNEDRPKKLPNFPLDESLMLKYKSEQPLPPNIISRFIVRHNSEIKKYNNKYLAWRLGVILSVEDDIAMVRVEDRVITLSVKGKNKTKYISALRETLNDIFNSYKSEQPELHYRIERFGKLPDIVEFENPLWLEDTRILNHYNRNRLYYDDYTNQEIPIEPIIDKYNINIENAIIGGNKNIISNKTLNFHDCSINLQGNLNNLSQLLSENGSLESSEEVAKVAKTLEKVENYKDKNEIKKTGIGNRLKNFIDELNDENSTLHKSIKNIKNGIKIAQDIGETYNDIAQWVGFPQVPKPFLKK